MFIVRGKPAAEVMQDKYQLDYFEVLNSVPDVHVALKRAEWEQLRKEAGKPLELEALPGE
ncbi:hypothetical protein ACFL43_06200 [Thermodesulfobacteriota bacterium]